MSVAPPAPSPSGTALLLALLVAGVAPAAWGAEPADPSERARFFFNQDDPEATVPSLDDQMKEPLQFGYYLQDGIDTALKASKDGDHARAAQYWAALAKAVPSRAYAFGRQCRELALGGDREGALTACEAACTRDGVTVGDYFLTARLLLNRPGELTADDRSKVKLLIEHLATQTHVPEAADQLRCRLALRDNDVGALQACTEALGKVSPGDPQTISFQWALAMAKHDKSGARRVIEEAKKSAMPPAAIARMESATDKLGLGGVVKVGIGALIAALAVGAVFVRRVKSARRVAA